MVRKKLSHGEDSKLLKRSVLPINTTLTGPKSAIPHWTNYWPLQHNIQNKAFLYLYKMIYYQRKMTPIFKCSHLWIPSQIQDSILSRVLSMSWASTFESVRSAFLVCLTDPCHKFKPFNKGLPRKEKTLAPVKQIDWFKIWLQNKIPRWTEPLENKWIFNLI